MNELNKLNLLLDAFKWIELYLWSKNCVADTKVYRGLEYAINSIDKAAMPPLQVFKNKVKSNV